MGDSSSLKLQLPSSLTSAFGVQKTGNGEASFGPRSVGTVESVASVWMVLLDSNDVRNDTTTRLPDVTAKPGAGVGSPERRLKP